MAHTLIGFVSVACLVGTLPLAAHAADAESLPMPRPFTSTLNPPYAAWREFTEHTQHPSTTF